MARQVPHPGQRNLWYHQGTSDLVVVFIHGFLSDSSTCWLSSSSPDQPSRYWPELVASDPTFGDASVFLAGYVTGVTAGDYGVRECADEVLTGLRERAGRDGRAVIDYPHILLVCHSAGGIVARYVLDSSPNVFKERKVFLLLMGSPSVGSLYARVFGAVGSVLGNKLAGELRAVSPLLADLDGRFKTLITERRIPQLAGLEAYEHLPVWRAWLPRIVGKESAGRYFGEPVVLRESDHITMVKPRSRQAQAHEILSKAAQRLRPELSPVENLFGRLASYQEFAEVLSDRYGFRWEPGTLNSGEPPSVYWPITLRSPSPIHALQAFVAAGLAKLGCTVNIWLDDFGNPDYQPEEFIKRLLQWFDNVGGPTSGVHVSRFSKDLAGSYETLWDKARKWLGETQYRLGKVLAVCKIARDAAEPDAQLLARRPRRLLKPVTVWAALEQHAERHGVTRILTLSGLDERPLWQAWAECAGSATLRVGHLFAPELLVSEAGTDRSLHMEQHPLAWSSREDIRSALKVAIENVPMQDVLRQGRLVPWCVTGCLLLPQYVRGQVEPLELGGSRVATVDDVADVPRPQMIDSLSAALAQALL